VQEQLTKAIVEGQGAGVLPNTVVAVGVVQTLWELMEMVRLAVMVEMESLQQ
jgi:hypothetical protein